MKRREVKGKREKERYTHLNAEFPRIARRDNKDFLRDQCKEIEENNRMRIWRRQWQPTPVFLPGESHGRGGLAGYSPWGPEELDTTERLHFHFSLSCIGEGNGNPLQCSCLENPRGRGAWWAAIYGVTQNQTRLKRLTSSSIRDLFKKIRDIKGTFHSKMASIKDRNGMDLTEAEDVARIHRRTVQKRASQPR